MGQGFARAGRQVLAKGKEMLTQIELKRLCNLRPKNKYITSLFLDINGVNFRKSDIITNLTHLIDEKEKNKNFKEIKKFIKKDFAKLKEFIDFDLSQSKNKGLALFLSEGNILKLYYLPFSLPNRLEIQKEPFIWPLLFKLSKQSRFLLVLLNRTQTKIFEVYQGIAHQVAHTKSDVPQEVKDGLWYALSEKRIDRHSEFHLLNHFKKTQEKIINFYKKYDFDGLILAGESENISFFKENLDDKLKNKIIEEIASNQMSLPHTAFLGKVFKIANKSKQKEEELIKESFHARQAYDLATNNLISTIDALKMKQVQVLLVANDIDASSKDDQLINSAIVSALKSNVAVKFISDKKIMQNRLAAFLRYPARKAA